MSLWRLPWLLACWLLLTCPEVSHAAATTDRSSSGLSPTVFCAWLSWSACDPCHDSSRSRQCHCDPVDFPPPELPQCDELDEQKGTCPTDSGGCFYAWPSAGVVVCGLALLIVTTALLVCLRFRQYYGRLLFCHCLRGNGSDSNNSHRHGPNVDVDDLPPALPGAYGFPPPSFNAAFTSPDECPPAYVECVLGGVGSAAPDATVADTGLPPPAYEEAVARDVKKEIRFSTQRWGGSLDAEAGQSSCEPAAISVSQSPAEGSHPVCQSDSGATHSLISQSDSGTTHPSISQSDSDTTHPPISQSDSGTSHSPIGQSDSGTSHSPIGQSDSGTTHPSSRSDSEDTDPISQSNEIQQNCLEGYENAAFSPDS